MMLSKETKKRGLIVICEIFEGDFTGIERIGFSILTELEWWIKDYIKVNIKEIKYWEEQYIKPRT
jgi:hypothetical protein